MGKWAEAAVTRFFSEANDSRKSQELELVRHHKLQAGVEKSWDGLRKFILSETRDFNKRLGRDDFFLVTDGELEIRVHAPQGSVICVLDARVPEIKVQHNDIFNLKPKDSTFSFLLKKGTEQEIVVIVDADANVTLTPDALGAKVLNPLVS